MARAFPNSPHAMREAKDDKFLRLIQKAKHDQKILKKDVAEAIGCTSKTMTRKLATPDNITLGELRSMRELLGWSAEDLDKII